VPFTPAAFAGPSGFLNGSPATFSGGFVQADYMIYPWMMAIMRWDRVNSRADLLNGYTSGGVGTPFFSPLSSVRNRFTPGAQFLIHANIKASFEYQIRPKQVVYNPGAINANGVPAQLISPFRTNTATAALEFVY
jgi:hypothetical protein